MGLAEELAQDALVSALEQGPREGIPRNPAACLTTVGKRRAIDVLRRRQRLESKLAVLGHELERGRDQPGPDADMEPGEGIEDDVLRLVFIAWHPVLSRQARVALSPRLQGRPADRRDRPGLPGLTPGEPEAYGLVALMEIQASRSAARTGPSGGPGRPAQSRVRGRARLGWPPNQGIDVADDTATEETSAVSLDSAVAVTVAVAA